MWHGRMEPAVPQRASLGLLLLALGPGFGLRFLGVWNGEGAGLNRPAPSGAIVHFDPEQLIAIRIVGGDGKFIRHVGTGGRYKPPITGQIASYACAVISEGCTKGTSIIYGYGAVVEYAEGIVNEALSGENTRIDR